MREEFYEFLSWVDENVVARDVSGWSFFNEAGDEVYIKETFKEIYEYWENLTYY